LTLYETKLRLEHDCPYTAFSKKLPSVIVQHWCSMDSDVLQFSGVDAVAAPLFRREMASLQKRLGSKFVREVSVDPATRIVVQRHSYSAMKPNVSAVVGSHNCLEVQPTVYRDGYEWYRILAFDQSDILELFRELSRSADIHVVSRNALPDGALGDALAISVRGLLGNLTDLQLRSLLAALRMGYYTPPRKVRTSELSDAMGTPRTTFESHLRKAEGKVLRGLLPFMELFAQADRSSGVSPS
jgi:predicted DNA binding protein